MHGNIITQGITLLFLSVSKISVIFLMIPIDSKKYMCRDILGYIYTLTIKLLIKEKIWNYLNMEARESNLLGNKCIVW